MKPAPLKSDTQHRLLSLNVLRGFDMFWITGGSLLAVVVAQATGWLSVYLGEEVGGVMMLLTGLAIIWGVLYFLYKKEVFVRI